MKDVVGCDKLSGSRQTGFDPGISEWGNPAGVMSRHPLTEYIGLGSERGEVKHLSTRRKRNQARFPK